MSRPSYKPGDVIGGQYEIKEIIGTGGFSRVYRAVELKLGRDVALKLMSPRDEPEFSNTETVLKRFDREARLVSQLTNPHTITLYDYDHLSDGRLFMALEFVDGATLDDLFERGEEFDAERIVGIVEQMLEALAEAHATGILHRDIKPSNIMLFDRYGRTDCVKLLDFGIAKKVATEDARHHDLTATGALIGTPRYMSPEQLKRIPLTAASDLYSVGLLILEMWTGEQAFETTDVTEIYRNMHLEEDLTRGLQSAPQPLRGVTEKLLEPEPEQRFESADEVLTALGHRIDEPAASEHSTSEADGKRVPVQPEFPVGFDRMADAPSSELTGVDTASGELTRAGKSELAASAEFVPAASSDGAVSGRSGGSGSAVPAGEVDPGRTPKGDRTTVPETSQVPDEEVARDSRNETTADVDSRPVWRRWIGVPAVLMGTALVAGAAVWGVLAAVWWGGSAESTSGASTADDAPPESRAIPSSETEPAPSEIEARASASQAVNVAVEAAEDRAREVEPRSSGASPEPTRGTEPAREPAPESAEPTPADSDSAESDSETEPTRRRAGEADDSPSAASEPSSSPASADESGGSGDEAAGPSTGSGESGRAAEGGDEEESTGVEVEPLE